MRDISTGPVLCQRQRSELSKNQTSGRAIHEYNGYTHMLYIPLPHMRVIRNIGLAALCIRNASYKRVDKKNKDVYPRRTLLSAQTAWALGVLGLLASRMNADGGFTREVGR